MSETQSIIATKTVEYRAVVGFPDYRIGNDGSVLSYKREKVRQLRPATDTNGYKFVRLVRRDGIGKSVSVHRLVLEAFVGPCPKGMEARHFPDRTKSNNCLANLSWATKLVNMNDQLAHGTRRAGQDKHNATISDETAAKVVTMLKESVQSVTDIAEHVGTKGSTVQSIASGRTWRALSGGRICRTKVYRRGERCKSSRLTEEQVVRIRREATSGVPYANIAKQYGVSEPTVFNVVRGKSWSHVGGPLGGSRTRGRPPKKACNHKDIG